MKFERAIHLYKLRFHDLPTIAMLPESAADKASAALVKAMNDGKPLTDADFYKAVGMEPPPDDAEI